MVAKLASLIVKQKSREIMSLISPRVKFSLGVSISIVSMIGAIINLFLLPETESSSIKSECYVKGNLISVTSDLMNELRPTHHVSYVSSVTLAKIASSMLNSGKGGCIYFGVNETRLIKGMKLTREMRDTFRVSIDDNFTAKINPSITHDMYGITFYPVVEAESLVSIPVCANHNLYVIKITLKPRLGLFFLNDDSCYVRIGDSTQLASAQQIREKAAAIEEEICLAEIDRLKNKIAAQVTFVF